MPNFVCGNNDSAEAAGVLNDGHAVHLLQALVHHTGTSDVSEACSHLKERRVREI